jgi:Zn finger protein HypA/HybF involved in hydrogenase expression
MKNSNNNEKFVTVATFTTSAEAHLAKIKLDAADIQCFVDNENNLYSPPFGYVRLRVWEKDREEALAILGLEAASDEETDADEIAVVCPYCKSDSVHYGINRDKTNILFIVRTFFLQSLPFYRNKIYCCNACNKHFKVMSQIR